MSRVTNLIWKLRIWKDVRAQDLIEYALIEVDPIVWTKFRASLDGVAG